ncbi:MAG: sugar phosphate nucleotidyltransferase [Thermoplasmata archaeon]
MRGLLTLAGEGSRMLPWTRGLRKELLPLYDRGIGGVPVMKPVANFVLETLIDAGLDDVVLVVGGQDGGAAVQNYFTIDREFLARHAHHSERLHELTAFYRRLESVRIRFVTQPLPHGFGDAVLRAQPFLGSEPFVLHAGDAVLLERHRGHVPSLLAKIRDRDDVDAVLFVRKVSNPRSYGVVEGKTVGREGDFRRLAVTGMEEKPAHPRSSWAATALYCFSPRIFDALKKVAREDPAAELELTAGIQQLLRDGASVAALVLDPRFADWRSVGSPDAYQRALHRTYTIARTGRAFGAPSTLGEVGVRSALHLPALLDDPSELEGSFASPSVTNARPPLPLDLPADFAGEPANAPTGPGTTEPNLPSTDASSVGGSPRRLRPVNDPPG